jgi:hypothetical protein
MTTETTETTATLTTFANIAGALGASGSRDAIAAAVADVLTRGGRVESVAGVSAEYFTPTSFDGTCGSITETFSTALECAQWATRKWLAAW